MSGEFRDFADVMREVAREEALRTSPPVERYRVVALKPMTLEAFGSELRLIDGEAGFDVAPALRIKAKVKDTINVLTDEHGDKIAIGRLAASPSPAPSDSEGKGGGGESGASLEELEAEEEEEDAGNAVAALAAAIATDGLGMIVHGDDESAPRGTTFGHYVWDGAAEPSNAKDADLWAKTA